MMEMWSEGWDRLRTRDRRQGQGQGQDQDQGQEAGTGTGSGPGTGSGAGLGRNYLDLERIVRRMSRMMKPTKNDNDPAIKTQ